MICLQFFGKHVLQYFETMFESQKRKLLIIVFVFFVFLFVC